jgi:NAD(P)-dependent dehydrogenase (short-subunit alcohol dehydrogenase family)
VVRDRGRLDVCVANAGISPTFSHVADLDLEVWRRVLDVNLTGAFLTLRGAARRMTAGTLLATSSVGGLRGGPGGSAYAASKFALRGLVESMAAELAPEITVNLVAPGDTDTPLHGRVRRLLAGAGGSPETVRAAMEQAIPAGRLADPAEIAAAFAFLASDEARYVTGTVLTVDGGSLLARRPRR